MNISVDTVHAKIYRKPKPDATKGRFGGGRIVPDYAMNPALSSDPVGVYFEKAKFFYSCVFCGWSIRPKFEIARIVRDVRNAGGEIVRTESVTHRACIERRQYELQSGIFTFAVSHRDREIRGRKRQK